MLVLLVVSPAYTAVILLAATLVMIAEYVSVRVSPAPLKVPVPKVVVPFLNVTLPVGPVPDAATTVAVKTSAVPTATGFAAAATVVVVVMVAAALTIGANPGISKEKTESQTKHFLATLLFLRNLSKTSDSAE